MRLFKTVRLSEHERGVAFRDGNFLGVLEAGVHRYFKRARHVNVDRAHANTLEFVHPNLLPASKVGLVRINGVARQLLAPGTLHAFWTHVNNVDVVYADHAERLEMPVDWLREIELAGDAFDVTNLGPLARVVVVDKGNQALLVRDGELVRTLGPGRHAFWRVGVNLQVFVADLRVQELELNGQEILTKDRVSLRVNAAAQYRIVDAAKSLVEIVDVDNLAYRAVQFALRETVGGVTLDQLLADKSALVAELHKQLEVQFQSLTRWSRLKNASRQTLPGAGIRLQMPALWRTRQRCWKVTS